MLTNLSLVVERRYIKVIHREILLFTLLFRGFIFLLVVPESLPRRQIDSKYSSCPMGTLHL